MKRRGFLKSVASIPAFTVVPGLSDRDSTNVVVNMRYQQMMDHGSLRVLKNGGVEKDIELQNRDLWNLTADYYANNFGLSIPQMGGFELYKLIYHQDRFWSLGYTRENYTLNLIDSTDGPYRSMLYDIGKRENAAVAESDRLDVIIQETREMLRQEFSSV